MAATLPTRPGCCDSDCEDVSSQQIVGPQGPAGTNGTNGSAGINAFTSTTANFTMPALAATAVATVVESGWASIGQIIYLQNAGWLRVTAKPASTQITLQNIETATEYTENVAPATVVASGSTISPGGLQGPAGAASASTFNSLSPTTTKGDIIVDNGANSPLANDVRLGVGTDGQVLAAVAAQPTGLQWTTVLPNAATDNGVPRFNGTAGTPVPLELSKVVITDNGAVQASGSGGNARGTDAVDLQVSRAAATQVASGSQSGIAAGRNNTSSNNRSFIGGGDANTASGSVSTVAGGSSNTASSSESFVGGGSTNLASGSSSSVVGGQNNTSSANFGVVGGGSGNTASGGGNAAVLGGQDNIASAAGSTVSGGTTNTASGSESFVGGGNTNTASGQLSAILCGTQAVANKYGQQAFSSGAFATIGDSQKSELIWRIATTNATPAEMFLDGATLRASVPNNTTWGFDIIVVGRSSAGVSAVWSCKGGIQNNAGTTTLVSAVTTAMLADGTGATWGVTGSLAVTADNVNDALVITMTGAAATLVRFTAHAKIIEVSY